MNRPIVHLDLYRRPQAQRPSRLWWVGVAANFAALLVIVAGLALLVIVAGLALLLVLFGGEWGLREGVR